MKEGGRKTNNESNVDSPPASCFEYPVERQRQSEEDEKVAKPVIDWRAGGREGEVPC